MKKLNKNENAITLIALVVTIVVLLILAGVSIAMLTGEDGIIRQAQRAREETEIGEEREKVNLAAAGARARNSLGEITKDNLKLELDDLIGVNKYTLTGDGPYTVTYTKSGRSYVVEGSGDDTTQSEDGTIAINEFSIDGTDVTTVPSVNGFVHVGGTIDEGYVISDNASDENQGVDANLVGNQFVWVPVKKDQKITLKVTSEEDITSIVITDPYGDDILTVTDGEVENSYSNEQINPTINGAYRLIIKTNNEERVKFLHVFSLYAYNQFFIDWVPNYSMDIYQTLEGSYEAGGYGYQEKLELALAKKEGFDSLEELLENWESGPFNDLQEWLEYIDFYDSIEDALGIGYLSKDEFIEKEEYAEKVNANGGFFVGRYEAGDSSTEEWRTADSAEGTLVVQKNQYVYNYIEVEDALKKAQDYKKEATSSLLTGAAWDRILGWLYETGTKSMYEIVSDSEGWGNYLNEYDEIIKTGTYEKTKTKNIYDIAGNVQEFTFGNSGRIKKGGACAIPEDVRLSSCCSSWIENPDKHTGFRVALYL